MMRITLFSLLMSVLWGSMVMILIHFCRKKPQLIRKIGTKKLLFLYGFSIVRMLVPCEFSFSGVFFPKAFCLEVSLPEFFLQELGKGSLVPKTGAAQPMLLSALAVLWIGGAAVLLVRFARRYIKSVWECSRYRICEGEQCQRVFRRVVQECGEQRRITLRCSGHVRVPMGIGIFKRSILLPECEYSDAELYYILLHEYTHFKNRDLLVKNMAYLFSCIYWWNPAVYLLRKDLPHILEVQCDLDVTGGMQSRDKVKYLATIVSVLKNASTKRKEIAFYGGAMLVAGTCESETVERFKIVSMESEDRDKNKLFTAAWFAALLLFFSLSYSFGLKLGDNGITEGESFVDIMRGNTESAYVNLHGGY